MISYNRSAFGINLLFRINGSAIYRSFVPGVFAMIIFLLLESWVGKDHPVDHEPKIGHPYAIGVVITGTTFLIVFRASQGYSRYWEAAGATYVMMSKWMDSAIHTSCYHMQCDHYKHIKPPSYFDHPELNRQYLTRDRERVRDLHEHDIDPNCAEQARFASLGRQNDESRRVTAEDHFISDQRSVVRSINVVAVQEQLRPATPINGMPSVLSTAAEAVHGMSSERSAATDGGSGETIQANTNSPSKLQKSKSLSHINLSASSDSDASATTLRNRRKGQQNRKRKKRVITAMSTRDLAGDDHNPRPLLGRGRLDGNWGPLFDDGKSTYYNRRSPMDAFTDRKGFASVCGGRTAPLFLQELAHLTSLLNAVALSTLRNDVDGAESPLDLYEPGTPWPSVDPTNDPLGWGADKYSTQMWRNLLFFLGMARTPEERTRYNASRPLPVLGGVSDNEIRFLQMARGPYAKTQLCWSWLSEFITREHLAGSLGNVGPPIISRVVQFLGDGMTQYNQARKIMFIPFPFVHAQLSALFVLVMVPTIPFLMNQYTESTWLGVSLTFLAVTCLSGIHEVARELENPFRNIPNELPVVTLQAEFNETLLTMYAGYHPDFFWDPHKLNNFHTSSFSNSPVMATAMDKSGEDNYVPALSGDIIRAISGGSATLRPARSSPQMEPVEEGDDSEQDATDNRRSFGTTDDESENEEGQMEGYLDESYENDERIIYEMPTITADRDIPIPPVDYTRTERYEEERKQQEIRKQEHHQQQKREGESSSDVEVDRLKLLVDRQAQMMERMMEEQSRLNKMVEMLILSKGVGEAPIKGGEKVIDA